VLVVSTPGRNAISVAELTVGLIISLARGIPAADAMVKSGNWLDPVGPYISNRGIELAGRTAGIIGVGAVGREVARRLRGLDMKMLAHDPYVDAEKWGVKATELDNLMKKSDVVTVHCALSPETANLVDARRLGMMKPTAFLVNTARWEIVQADALLAALRQKRIAGAAFDVYETHPVPRQSPPPGLDNVILTPHLGGATDGTIARQSRMMVEDIERFLRGERPVNLVNPGVWA
jgi:D-3-phosphoglycerate dehydrogenase